MLDRAPYLVEPYLDALAATGQFDRLVSTARERSATAHATWLLATNARPFSALAMQRLARGGGREPEAVAGGALALFLAGRPDLAALACDRDRPEARLLPGVGVTPFPGPDELWQMEHEPERCPAMTALATSGLAALLGHVHQVVPGADPDHVDVALLAEREKDLRSSLAGATVCLVGELAQRRELIAALQAQGAQLVDGPFARTDYYIAGADADPTTLARLRSLGVRELPAHGPWS